MRPSYELLMNEYYGKTPSHKCQFCRDYCFHLTENYNPKCQETYRCNDCKIFYTLRDNKIHMIQFAAKIKNKYYCLEIMCNDNKTYLREVELDSDEGQTYTLDNKIILELNTIPQNISPTNIEDKIKTFLVFL